MPINYREFIHPEDEAARQQLEAVPGFQNATKWFMDLGIETYCHGLFMGEKIRLSPTQLPELYNHLPPICRKFGITEPEFYLEMNPGPNAYTLGDKRTFLVVTSGLLSHVKNDDELVAVLAHECGHILCRHVFYRTMASLASRPASLRASWMFSSLCIMEPSSEISICRTSFFEVWETRIVDMVASVRKKIR